MRYCISVDLGGQMDYTAITLLVDLIAKRLPLAHAQA